MPQLCRMPVRNGNGKDILKSSMGRSLPKEWRDHSLVRIISHKNECSYVKQFREIVFKVCRRRLDAFGRHFAPSTENGERGGCTSKRHADGALGWESDCPFRHSVACCGDLNGRNRTGNVTECFGYELLRSLQP